MSYAIYRAAISSMAEATLAGEDVSGRIAGVAACAEMDAAGVEHDVDEMIEALRG